MPPKKAKVAEDRPQVRVGLPKELVQAVVRMCGEPGGGDAGGVGGDGGAGGAAGGPAGRRDAGAQDAAARELTALMRATVESIAFVAARPSFVSDTVERLRVQPELSDKIDALKRCLQQQASGAGTKGLSAPSFALAIALNLLFKSERTIEGLKVAAARDSLASADVQQDAGVAGLTVPDAGERVGHVVTPATVDRREARLEGSILNLRMPEFTALLRQRTAEAFDTYFRRDAGAAAVSGPAAMRQSVTSVLQDPYLARPVHPDLRAVHEHVRALDYNRLPTSAAAQALR